MKIKDIKFQHPSIEKTQNKWQKYVITFNEDTKMSSPLLQYTINKFKQEIISNLSDNQFYHCQLQCQFHVIDEVVSMDYYVYRSISYLQFFMKNGSKESSMLEVFWHFWTTFYEERYKLFLVKSICIQYKVLPTEYNNLISPEDVQSNINPKPLQERVNKTVEHFEESEVKPQEIIKYKNHLGYNLPLTMDITKWGYTIFNKYYTSAVCWVYNINNYTTQPLTKNTSLVLYNSNNITLPEYKIEIKDFQMNISLRIKGNELFSFEDKLLHTTLNQQLESQDIFYIKGESSLTNFTRKINGKNIIYLFINNTEQFMIKEKKVPFISSKTNKDSFKGIKFITMDLETKSINGVLTPYCVSIFNGKTVSSFYITDFKDSNELLENAVKSLMKKEYNGYKVYLHNFSYFDGIFLLTVITLLSNNVKILIRDSRILDVKVGFGKNNIFFRDSLLMIPLSLAKAAKSFNVEDKGYFPYRFVNQEEITYDYVGPVPSYEYFEQDKVTEDEYKEYIKNFNNDWNLEKETIKYCEQDCITLYQILQKFSSFIYDEFKINFLNTPTLSSLAFIIYRTNFMTDLENKLPIITGKIYSDIKKSYTGGAVDVYLPYGENLYLYDINSLYPSVMKDYPMPVGQPKYFEGDIRKYNLLTSEISPSDNTEDMEQNNERPFGFFEVEITTPEDILNPILQTKLNLKGRSKRTIAPIGKWIGWYFSEELYNAENYGYKFKILRGYTFEKEYIFPDYVNFLYDIKCNSEPKSAMYTVSKLLLNSLYGRLGMSPYVENHKVIDNKKSNDFILNEDYVVTNVVDLQNGKEIISYFNKNDIKAIDNGSTTKNISIAIASAVTAYARIRMSKIKMDKTIKIYYSDTDSFVVDKELNGNIVSERLGQFKLENEFIRAAFLAPKVYGGILKNKLDKNGSPSEKVKVKGLKKSIKFEELVTLLKKDSSLKKPQEKFYRDLANGRILVDTSDYTLVVTGNKRKIIYENDIFTKTKPLKIHYDVIVE